MGAAREWASTIIDTEIRRVVQSLRRLVIGPIVLLGRARWQLGSNKLVLWLNCLIPKLITKGCGRGGKNRRPRRTTERGAGFGGRTTLKNGATCAD
ncbi:hypothetical protein EVAR_82322_1 [Eumeta japonica]|uniref:Uncharacterized protein n=1 Tax=Eumeta variegata TaxID=151549 RepID=A0A4C1UAP2_EUMVA|nr:hypothetical protein EVAR_82322_1 [Eumeta japonica]